MFTEQGLLLRVASQLLDWLSQNSFISLRDVQGGWTSSLSLSLCALPTQGLFIHSYLL